MHGSIWLLFPSNMAFLFVGEQFPGAWSSTRRSTQVLFVSPGLFVCFLWKEEVVVTSVRAVYEVATSRRIHQKNSAQCPQPCTRGVQFPQNAPRTPLLPLPLTFHMNNQRFPVLSVLWYHGEKSALKSSWPRRFQTIFLLTSVHVSHHP